MKMKNKLLLLCGITAVSFVLLQGIGFFIAHAQRNSAVPERAAISNTDLKVLAAKNRLLKQQIHHLSPKGTHLAIDTATNTLYLKKGGTTVRQMTVSSGSGHILRDPSGARTWVFDTPRGEFSVRSKQKNPDWVKPDWAFIEEGVPIPKNAGERVEKGVLGDYALGFGDGYFIHGTLYTRLLGRNVTHGCVRVGDKDLKELFYAAPLGTKVIIF